MTPATPPMAIASMGWTKPEAGVMATRPATAPAAAPITLGLPPSSQLAIIQESAAAAAAVLVTTNALAATGLAAPALPAVKPNQPNQRIGGPKTMEVTVGGCRG